MRTFAPLPTSHRGCRSLRFALAAALLLGAVTQAIASTVDWWFDFRSYLIYSLTVNIVGPKGIPHE
ncbi:MAG: hypothetical protein N2688_07495 [Burkholderiaceae bacterium]|nr:hypothetical protein [Burkholderiaceae bacterium]